MKVKSVNTFNDLIVYIEKAGVNLDSTNRKLRLQRGDIQISIFPNQEINPFKGAGSLQAAQQKACSHRCEFKVGASLGGCYVNHLSSKFRKLARDSALEIEVESDCFVRATVWGDIGRLNLEGQEFILSLLKRASKRTAYISDFAECLPEFRDYAQASCQTAHHVTLAKLLGWSVYAGTQEASQALRGYLAPKYKCPVKGNGEDKFGCRTCPIKCDGRRDVVAHSVHRV